MLITLEGSTASPPNKPIAALFRVFNRYVGDLAPMPGVFPDNPAPVIRDTETGRELAMMRWSIPPPRAGLRKRGDGPHC
jgi:hypothetical protein